MAFVEKVDFEVLICNVTPDLESGIRLTVVGMADDVAGGFVGGEDDPVDHGLTDAAAPADAFDKGAHEAELPAIARNGQGPGLIVRGRFWDHPFALLRIALTIK